MERRRSAGELAEALVALHGAGFAGRPGGKYRISRKFLRQLAGRRKLSEAFVAEVAAEVFERGYVLVDLETHYAVLDQSLIEGFRRVTALALARAAAE